jgi:hypothetical protein
MQPPSSSESEENQDDMESTDTEDDCMNYEDVI